MSTIFEPLSESITNQIKIRQDIMANKVTNPTVRNAYLNRACKVRLVPLVKDTKGDTDYNDFVFGNFTLEDNFFNNPDFKFSDKAEKPYINNFETVTRSGDNYGATRTGKISIVVPTKKQFNLIERYFRIGVPFLLEWGWVEHVKYEGNNPTKETTEFIDPKLYEGDNINKKELEKAVFNNKEAQNGNYDGGIFVIKNFTTNIQNNGVDYYYVLDINMVTTGDILNSLKQNRITDPTTSQSADIENRIDSEPIIRLLRFLNQQGVENIEKTIRADDLLEAAEFNPEIKDVFSILSENLSTIIDELKQNYINFTSTKTEFDYKKARSTASRLQGLGNSNTYSEGTTKTTTLSFSYIKLGYFLELLNKFDIDSALLYIKGDFEYKLPLYYYNLPNESTDYYFWEWDVESELSNFASMDPSKFVLPHYRWNIYFSDKNITQYGPEGVGSGVRRSSSIPFISKDNNKKISNILLNTEFLINEISNLIRKDEYSINNILSLILNTINRYTDNDIRLIKYDINDYSYSIVSIVDGDDLNTNSLLTLKLYGTGSIVEETTIDTVINDQISSQIAIMMNGSSDYVTDSQAISLLKFNNGIKSRIKSDLPPKGDGRINLQSILSTISLELIKYHTVLTPKPDSDYIKDGPQFDILKLYKKFKQEYIAATIEYKQHSNIKGTPLFPIKIKTRLPGISGIKIGHKLKVDDVRLPDIYVDRNVYYTVTNYNSTVNNRYWESYIDLSPQINTQLIQPSQSEYESKQGLAQEADIDNVLDAIKAVETGGYYFKGNRGPEWLKGGEPPPATEFSIVGPEDLYIRFPLYTDGFLPGVFRGLFIDERTARRGPFQLTPMQYFEIYTANNDIIEYDFDSDVAGSPDARYLWKNPESFNDFTDTVLNSRIIAQKYIEKLRDEIPSKERTYLRLLSFHYLGREAISLDDLKQFNENKGYLDFLREGQQYLINNLGVDRKELTDQRLYNIGIRL
jgi:hypothetical protein